MRRKQRKPPIAAPIKTVERSERNIGSLASTAQTTTINVCHDMRVFDTLPKVLRDTLNETGVKYGAEDVSRAIWMEGADRVARRLRQFDAENWRRIEAEHYAKEAA